MFIKGFNALQLTTLFAAFPWLMEMVKSADFYAHNVLFWIMIVAYVIGFIGMVCAVFSTMDND